MAERGFKNQVRIGQNLLYRWPLRIDGSQDLVPVQHVTEGELQSRTVELTAQVDGNRQIVRTAGGVEGVEHPHTLLIA